MLFYFVEFLFRRNFAGQASRSIRARHTDSEDAEKHPSLPAEHCTLARNVKTRHIELPIFLRSLASLETNANAVLPASMFSLQREDRVSCSASRTPNQEKRRSGRPPLRSHVDQDKVTLLRRRLTGSAQNSRARWEED